MARPRLGDTPTIRFHMRWTEEDLALVDDWRFPQRIGSLSEAVRTLCRLGVEVDGLRNENACLAAENERLREALACTSAKEEQINGR